MSGGLYISFSIRIVWNPPRPLEGLIRNKVVESLAEDMSRLRVSHKIKSEIDHVKQVEGQYEEVAGDQLAVVLEEGLDRAMQPLLALRPIAVDGRGRSLSGDCSPGRGR